MHEKSIFFTDNPGQTRKAGAILAREILKTRPGKKAVVVGLSGDLGGGKTTFLQGLAGRLGVRQKILSPTFVIVRRLSVPGPGKFKELFHIDCYRVRNPKELLLLGLGEIMAQPENIVVVEWADKILDILPSDVMILKFDYVGLRRRRIECTLKKQRRSS